MGRTFGTNYRANIPTYVCAYSVGERKFSHGFRSNRRSPGKLELNSGKSQVSVRSPVISTLDLSTTKKYNTRDKKLLLSNHSLSRT